MRVATVTILIAVALAMASPAALAQDAVGDAAADLPTTLFQPAPDGVPAGTQLADEGGGGASRLVGAILVVAAVAAGYFAGSSSRTRRS